MTSISNNTTSTKVFFQLPFPSHRPLNNDFYKKKVPEIIILSPSISLPLPASRITSLLITRGRDIVKSKPIIPTSSNRISTPSPSPSVSPSASKITGTSRLIKTQNDLRTRTRNLTSPQLPTLLTYHKDIRVFKPKPIYPTRHRKKAVVVRVNLHS